MARHEITLGVTGPGGWTDYVVRTVNVRDGEDSDLRAALIAVEDEQDAKQYLGQLRHVRAYACDGAEFDPEINWTAIEQELAE
jgi:hypothetical protein